MARIQQHPLTSFFLLAFAFSWIITAVMIARYNGWIDASGWLHYLVAWGPALAAIVVTAVAYGRDGLTSLRKRVFQWRLSGTDWLLAVGTPLALLGAGVFVSWITSDTQPDLTLLGYLDYLGQIGIPAALLVWIMTFGIGEEIGWRGFAQHHMEPKRGLLTVAIFIGVIWAFWHLPHFFYKDTFIEMGLVGFPFYVVNIVPGAIVLGWLYSRTRSVLAVGLWHGLFDFATAAAIDGGTVPIVMSACVILWAIWIVRQVRGSHADPSMQLEEGRV